MKTVFMGTPEFAEVILRGLHQGGQDIQMVLTQPDRKNGRGKQVRFSPVKETALELGIDVLQPENLKNDISVQETLKALKPDVLVVASYGQILPKSILDIPKFGAINVHASLLPKLRGASPIQHAILLGEEETGITIMRMDVGLDTGDMISKRTVKIGDMNYTELHDKLAEVGSELLLETLPLIENGTAQYEKQDDALSTYAPLIRKEDGHINFSGSAAKEVLKIRAFDPWPGAFAHFGNDDQTVKFWKGEAVLDGSHDDPGTVKEVYNNHFIVSCADGSLVITEIQVPGKKRCPVSDYLRGHSLEKGQVFR